MDRPPARERSVLLVGGGLAGIAAATLLAEQGVAVTLIEREAYLGGRVGAWQDRLRDGTSFQMERGFHAFFRHYENVRALIRRVDPTLSCLTPLNDYPLISGDGQSQSFMRLPKTPPLNVIALLLKSPHIRLRDLVHADLDRARMMLAFDHGRTYAELDSLSAKQFLDELRFPVKARQMLFDVFAHSFFNPEAEYSAAELLAMFHFYFTGNTHGLLFDVAREPFSTAIIDPLAKNLVRLGVRIITGAACETIESTVGGGFRAVYRAGDERGAAEGSQLVLAVTVPALKQIVADSSALRPLASTVASLDVTLPFAVLRLWLDREAARERAPFAGTTGFELLDNISLYEKIEGESARWAQRSRGSVVELHAYAVPEALSHDAVRRTLLDDLHRAYPETRAARVLEERFLVKRDCPAFRPGSHQRRPTVRTAARGVFLAGDGIRLPFPSALMERAVASGFLAANEALAGFGLATRPIAHGPTRGLLAALDRVASTQ